MKSKIYLDDVRIPIDESWIVVKNYEQFVDRVLEIGIENIDLISLDHDLGPQAMSEYFNNVSPNYNLDYNNLVDEKTGYDCAKWIVDHFYDKFPDRIDLPRNKKRDEIHFPKIVVHSANPIGSSNIMGYINNFLMNEAQDQSCIRVRWEHTIDPNVD
jgi:hypothetical protein